MQILALRALAVLGLFLFATSLPAIGQTVLSGNIASAEEGPMEGVLVSAQRPGSTITITVASDRRDFSASRAASLARGPYVWRVRATGYDPDSPGLVEVGEDNPATADLKLRKTEDLAAQLSNGE